MRASTKNLILGGFHRMRGTVRIAVGNTINRRRVALFGHVERVRGIMRWKFGRMERVVGL